MQIHRYQDAGVFLEHVQPFLESQEAKYSVVLGILLRLREHPDWIDLPPYLREVQDSTGTPALVGIMTPPHNLLLAGNPDIPQEALDLLIADLIASSTPIPGVNAEQPLSERFTQAWTRISGQRAHIHLRMRLYRLEQVIFPSQPPPGFFRKAEMADLAKMVRWQEEFSRESLHEEPAPQLARDVERHIQSGTMYIWDDNGPVSTAARARETPHGSAINAVYTSPQFRGRGYASTCVASLSQRLLDAGKDFCVLFTDLDYPTSNAIYQKIGYKPVTDFYEYFYQ